MGAGRAAATVRFARPAGWSARIWAPQLRWALDGSVAPPARAPRFSGRPSVPPPDRWTWGEQHGGNPFPRNHQQRGLRRGPATRPAGAVRLPAVGAGDLRAGRAEPARRTSP